MTDWTDFKLGQAVTVRQGPDQPAWASDWTGQFVIVGMDLNYRGDHRVNFSLASADEIEHGHGSTDGFRDDQLVAIG